MASSAIRTLRNGWGLGGNGGGGGIRSIQNIIAPSSTFSIDPVDPGQTILLVSQRIAGSGMNTYRYPFRARLQDATTITMQSGLGDPTFVRLCLIEFDGLIKNLIRGDAAIPAGSSFVTVPHSFNREKTMAHMTGAYASTGLESLRPYMLYADVRDSDVYFANGQAVPGVSINFSYEIVEFK